jgi:hypothetical protein
MQTEGHWKRNPKDSCSLEFPQLAEMTELFGTLSDVKQNNGACIVHADFIF